EIRRMVRFRRQDLLAAGDYPRADLILCRNVLIYFSRPEQERIADRFAQALPPGGFLVIGRAENLFGAARERFHGEVPRERIYRRLEDHSASLPQGVERCV
ncbi:MAG: CheR family methyltransferase, partial [Trichloromonas sp.]|nr:CheR family methyltransferase [Trichloromonas sp.]